MTTNPAVRRRRSIRLKDYDYTQAGSYFITICTHNRQPFFGKIANGEMRLNEIGKIARDEWHQIPVRFENVELGPFVVMPNHIHGVIIINEPIGAGFTPAQNYQTGQAVNGQPQIGQPSIGQPQGLPQQEGFTPAQDCQTGQPVNGQSQFGQPSIGQPQGLPQQEGFTPAQNYQTGQSQFGQPSIGQPQGLPQRITVGNIVGAYKSLVANECLKIYQNKNEFMGKLWQRNYYERIIRNEKAGQAIAEYILNNPAKWEFDNQFLREEP